MDPTILDAHLSLLLNTNPAVGEKIPFAMGILDILSVRHERDGEAYAGRVIELTRRLDQEGASPQVFKEVIEAVLNSVHLSGKWHTLLKLYLCLLSPTPQKPTTFLRFVPITLFVTSLTRIQS